MAVANKVKAWSGVAASVLAAAVAWHQLGGWVPAGADQVAELETFGRETRILFLEDKLWEHRQALRRTRREIEGYNGNSRSAPGWMLQDEVDLERRIERLEREIKGLQPSRTTQQ